MLNFDIQTTSLPYRYSFAHLFYEKYLVNILYMGYRTNLHPIHCWMECESHLN